MHDEITEKQWEIYTKYYGTTVLMSVGATISSASIHMLNKVDYWQFRDYLSFMNDDKYLLGLDILFTSLSGGVGFYFDRQYIRDHRKAKPAERTIPIEISDEKSQKVLTKSR